MYRTLAFFLLFVFSTTVSRAGEDLVVATNLQIDAQESRTKNRPIVTLISSHTCEYCEAVKRSDFQFMTNDDRFILREVNIDVTEPLINFDGSSTTHRTFVETYVSVFTPTVLFFNAEGEQLADPLVGVSTLEYYGHYLEKKIEQSINALQTPN